MSILSSAKNLAKIGINNTKKGAKVATRATTNGAKSTSKKIIKSAIIDSKDKEGNVKKSLSNIYTGKKMNPLHVGVAGLGYLAFKNAKHGFEHKTLEPLKLATMNNYQELGAPDIMMYDGVGQEPAPKNLNADGSIVFGLHNSRRG